QAGETTGEVAEALGRSVRWVRKWTARHAAAEPGQDWAASVSRAPHRSPNRTSQAVRDQVLAVRAKLEVNPQSQYGPLAIAWELELLGVAPVPEVWTINRILAQAGVTRRRGRQPGYQSKGAPYPHPTTRGPGEYHQADLIGPRNLDGGIGFHAFNLIDVGTHTAGSEIIDILRPTTIAASLATIWSRVGLPKVIQFDNHSNLRGAIPPRASTFGPVVATCLELGVGLPGSRRCVNPGATGWSSTSTTCGTSRSSAPPATRTSTSLGSAPRRSRASTTPFGATRRPTHDRDCRALTRRMAAPIVDTEPFGPLR
ncbi:MAG: hypothetical protein WD627_11075, partial [Actinomycetota bacterium]